MDPQTTPPAEARLIRTAREATGITAAEAARRTEGFVSPAYWRDVERGWGYRRGERAPARASARVLARMAQVTGVTPERLEAEGGRQDAAEVLREALRQQRPRLAQVPPLQLPPESEDVPRKVLDLLLSAPPEDWPFLLRLWDLRHQPEEERLDLMRAWLRRDSPETAAGPRERRGGVLTFPAPDLDPVPPGTLIFA